MPHRRCNRIHSAVMQRLALVEPVVAESTRLNAVLLSATNMPVRSGVLAEASLTVAAPDTCHLVDFR